MATTNSITFPGTVTASGFTGTSTNATNAVLATDATDASRPVIFGTATTGNVPLKTDPGLVYNPSSNKLTAGAFVGDGSELTGISAGFDPNVDIIKIGNGAGAGQGANAIAIGHDAGSSGTQGQESVAIGYQAGQATQGYRSVAIGYLAAANTQQVQSVAIGQQAGQHSQSANSVAVGNSAGVNAQGGGSVAIGYLAGSADQGALSVAIGKQAGQNAQGNYAIAIGWQAGKTSQTMHATAIGYGAGQNSQGSQSVAVGNGAGSNVQGPGCTAIGVEAGNVSQGEYSVAVGHEAGKNAQGNRAVAVGRDAGCNAQGERCIAIGWEAGHTNQPNSSFYTTYGSVRSLTGTRYDLYIGTTGEFLKNTSDDRLKHDEKFITGAVKSLFKLRPQEYLKRQNLDANVTPQGWTYEAGLMAQEVYYSAPELRHMVMIPPEAGDIDNYTPPPSDDPTQDPDYSMWGNDVSTIDYNQLTPYLVKAVQEIVTELPRSKTTVSNTWGQNIQGLVVSANMNTHKTNVTPNVTLSNVHMDKKWYGVVSDKKTDTNDYDTLIDTKGDTRIWVTDVGGPLESGDLLTTSNIAPGFTQKQDDDLIHNYTVAKLTQDCDFTEPTQNTIKVPKQELSNVTYYRHDASWPTTLDRYENISDFRKTIEETPIYFKEVVKNSEFHNKTRYYEGETEVSEIKYDTLPEDVRSIKYLSEISVEDYDALSVEDKATYSTGTSKMYKVIEYSQSKTQIPQHDEQVIVEELVDVLDENGQIVWEETGETEPVYTLVDHGTYKAALVSCKLT